MHNAQTTNHQTKPIQTKRTTNAKQTNQTNETIQTTNTFKACGMTRQSDYGRPLGPSVSVSA
jgi:hypothetical protein